MNNIKMLTITLLIIGFLGIPILTHAVTEGLVAFWAFDETEGGIANDSSGNGHDGALVGDPQWVDGYYGGALEFDQAQDEVNITFHEDLNPETFTICAWANTATDGTGHRAVMSSRDDFPQRGVIFYANPSNVWQFWTGVGEGWNPVTGPAVNLEEWDHLAGVYADGKQKFYVNGNLVAEADASLSVNTAQEFLIGAGANETDSHNFFFKGKIDEVLIYNRALSEDEIAAVMETKVTAVEPYGKAAITWGQLKAK